MTESKLPLRNYSDEEINALYALGRFYLELGQLRSAEQIFRGLVVVAPSFVKSYVGLIYVLVLQGQEVESTSFVDQAKTLLSQSGVESDELAAQLLLFDAIIKLTLGELAQAGTSLGEVNDLIDRGSLSDPAIIKIFKSQLARYQGNKQLGLVR